MSAPCVLGILVGTISRILKSFRFSHNCGIDNRNFRFRHKSSTDSRGFEFSHKCSTCIRSSSRSGPTHIKVAATAHAVFV